MQEKCMTRILHIYLHWQHRSGFHITIIIRVEGHWQCYWMTGRYIFKVIAQNAGNEYVKRHAEKDYPSGCFSRPRAAHQHESTRAYGPPLILPTHSSSSSISTSSHCHLENGSFVLKAWNPPRCILSLDIKPAYSHGHGTVHQAWIIP